MRGVHYGDDIDVVRSDRQTAEQKAGNAIQ